MFIHDEAVAGGAYLISQASHAAMAWQIAEHWGNRRFLRPSPRAETLIAVMLHDAGWLEFDVAPGIDEGGRPLTFDRMSVGRHLEIWRMSVIRAGAHSRYAGLLVAAHHAELAERKLADVRARGDTDGVVLVEAFQKEMNDHRQVSSESLAADARYEACLGGRGRQTNAAILAMCDRISVFLCADFGSSFEIEAPAASGGLTTVRFSEGPHRRWTARPWPFQGDRIRLQGEGLRLGSMTFRSAEDLHRDMVSAPAERLRFDIVRSSTQS